MVGSPLVSKYTYASIRCRKSCSPSTDIGGISLLQKIRQAEIENPDKHEDSNQQGNEVRPEQVWLTYRRHAATSAQPGGTRVDGFHECSQAENRTDYS